MFRRIKICIVFIFVNIFFRFLFSEFLDLSLVSEDDFDSEDSE